MDLPRWFATTRPSLSAFFTLAFALSWLIWLPAALVSYGWISWPLDPNLSGLLGAFGPSLAALILTLRHEGMAGVRSLLKRLLRWRVGLPWYAFVLLWPAALSLARSGIAVLLGSTPPDFSQPPFVQFVELPPEVAASTPFLAFLPFIFLQQTLLGSSMGEELGWRGYALPRLQGQMDSFRASVLLGLLWGLWHLPLWLTQGHPQQNTFLLWPLLTLVATSVLFTWVYNHSRGSLLLMLLFHSAIAVTGLFLASAEAHPAVESLLSWGAALLVAQRLTPSTEH